MWIDNSVNLGSKIIYEISTMRVDVKVIWRRRKQLMFVQRARKSIQQSWLISNVSVLSKLLECIVFHLCIICRPPSNVAGWFPNGSFVGSRSPSNHVGAVINYRSWWLYGFLVLRIHRLLSPSYILNAPRFTYPRGMEPRVELGHSRIILKPQPHMSEHVEEWLTP